MKASMKFREDQKPLIRAKIPLSILTLPFQSSIIAGESKELSLNLSTFFESGPSFKVAYRPNDSWNPFSFIVKTGTGSFGSPISSSMLMSAEFNGLGQGNPSFMLNFKPRFGAFSIKKSCSSSGVEMKSEEDFKSPVNGGFINVMESPDLAGLFSSVEVTARTTVPVRGRAVVNCRWGVRVPTEIRRDFDPTALRRFPFLVMNKIGFEHVDGSDSKDTKSTNDPSKVSGPDLPADVALALMEELRTENKQLKRAVKDLREVITNHRRSSPQKSDYGLQSKYGEAERSKSRSDRWRSSEKTTSDYGVKRSKEGR